MAYAWFLSVRIVYASGPCCLRKYWAFKYIHLWIFKDLRLSNNQWAWSWELQTVARHVMCEWSRRFWWSWDGCLEITRCNVWPCLWIGPAVCCMKSKECNSCKKPIAMQSLSICKLKWPVIRILSWLVKQTESSSEMSVKNEAVYLDINQQHRSLTFQ